GEYESSLVPWGERSGDFLVEKAALAFERLQAPEAGGADVLTAPLAYSPTGDPPFAIDVSDSARVGTVVVDLPEQVARFQTVEFAWVGGDPGAEAPQAPLVTLLRAEPDGTTFSPVLLPGGMPYTNH